MLRESGEYFLLVTLAAFALRLFFYFRFPHVTGDSLIYGDIAKNWLQHGIYGLSHAEGPRPYLDPPARLSRISGGLLRAFRKRALPRGPAGADCH